MKALPLFALVLLPLAGTAFAQSDAGCPTLPADAGLEWEHKTGPGFDICRALRTSDHSQVFGVYLSSESPFEPKRSNRAEKGEIDGHQIRWYEGELATEPDMEVRETLVELGDDRIAHIWLDARGEDALRAAIELAEGISFKSTQLSGR